MAPGGPKTRRGRPELLSRPKDARRARGDRPSRAKSPAVRPSSAASAGSAPCARRRATKGASPCCAAACRAVNPPRCRAFGSAPRSRSSAAVSSSRAAAALQGRHPRLLVARDDVDQRAALHQESRGLRSPEERGQMKRREAILGPCADTPRIGVEQLLDPVRAADGSGLEDVKLRPLREQLVHPRPVAAIDGCQQLTQRTCPRPSTGARSSRGSGAGRARLDLVPRARRDEDGIARADLPLVAATSIRPEPSSIT